MGNAYFDDIYYTVIDLLMHKAANNFCKQYENEIYSMKIEKAAIEKFMNIYDFISIKMGTPSMFEILPNVAFDYFDRSFEIAKNLEYKLKHIRI